MYRLLLANIILLLVAEQSHAAGPVPSNAVDSIYIYIYISCSNLCRLYIYILYTVTKYINIIFFRALIIIIIFQSIFAL